jgi:hypothetical protein
MNRNEYLKMRERRIMQEREPMSMRVFAGFAWIMAVLAMLFV